MENSETFDFYQVEEYWSEGYGGGEWQSYGQVQTVEEAEDWVSSKPNAKRRYVGKNFLRKTAKW